MGEEIKVINVCCDKCIHKEVCTYKGSLFDIQKEVENIKKDCIFTINIACNFYKGNVFAYRNGQIKNIQGEKL